MAPASVAPDPALLDEDVPREALVARIEDTAWAYLRPGPEGADAKRPDVTGPKPPG